MAKKVKVKSKLPTVKTGQMGPGIPSVNLGITGPGIPSANAMNYSGADMIGANIGMSQQIEAAERSQYVDNMKKNLPKRNAALGDEPAGGVPTGNMTVMQPPAGAPKKRKIKVKKSKSGVTIAGNY